MQREAAEKSPPTVLPYAWVILFAVYMASVVAPFNQFKVPPLMPVVMEYFQVNLTQAGSMMSLIALTGLVLALPAGIILQRWGPKATGLIALACMAGGAAVGALASNYSMLLVSRMIEGVGVGLIGVVAPATIAMWFPPARQGAPMGIWATWVPVGSVAVYNIAPILVKASGWQAVWWVGAGFGLLMMVLYGLLIRQPAEQENARAEDRQPLDLRKALANRDIWLLGLQFACFNVALIGLSTYYPTFLNEVKNFPLDQAAFTASIATILVLVSAPLAGWLSDKTGSRRKLLAISFLLVGVTLLLPFRVDGWQIPGVMVLQGLSVGAIPTITFAAAPEIMRKPHLAGLGLSVVLIGQNVGQLLGPVFFSSFVKNFDWVTAGDLLIPFCLIGFLSAWFIKIR